MEQIIANLTNRGEAVDTVEDIRNLLFEIDDKHKKEEKRKKDLERKKMLNNLIPGLGKQQLGASKY